MSNMKLFLELGVKGQNGFKSAMNDMANTTSRSTRKMAASWASVENRMSGVSSSITKIGALLGGGALLRQAVIDVMNFERGLVEMRLTGDLTAKEMGNVRKQIIALSSETLQLPEEQLQAFKDMVAAGIDPGRVLSGLKAIDRTATATFSNVGDIGKTTVDLLQKMNINPEKLERSFNILHKAGKSGRFELKDMARFFPEVLASASQYGVTGERGVAQVAAMLQIARRNRGEPGEAATDMKAFFSKIVSYRKQFKKVGLNVYDFIDLESGKFKAGKDIDAFFEELRKKTKGGSTAMLKSIGIEDTESTNFMAGLMKDWADYKKIRDDALSGADQNIIGKDFDEVSKTTWANAKRLEIERSKAMKSTGSSSLAEKTMQAGNWAIENPLTAGGGAIGIYAGWKLLQGSIQRFIGGGKNGNMGGGGSGGVVPVMVTNWPASGLPGTTTPVSGRPGGAAKTGSFAKYLIPGAMYSLPVAVAAAPLISAIISDKARANGWGSQSIPRDSREYEVMGVGGRKSQTKNDIHVDIHFDDIGRPFISTKSMDTYASVGGKRGDFFDALMTSKAM